MNSRSLGFTESGLRAEVGSRSRSRLSLGFVSVLVLPSLWCFLPVRMFPGQRKRSIYPPRPGKTATRSLYLQVVDDDIIRVIASPTEKSA